MPGGSDQAWVVILPLLSYHVSCKQMQPFVVSELIKGAQTPERLAPIIVPIHGLVEEPHSPPAEEEGGIPIPTSGLLQVAERRRK